MFQSKVEKFKLMLIFSVVPTWTEATCVFNASITILHTCQLNKEVWFPDPKINVYDLYLLT